MSCLPTGSLLKINNTPHTNKWPLTWELAFILKIKRLQIKTINIPFFWPLWSQDISNRGRKYRATNTDIYTLALILLYLWLYNSFLLDALQIPSSTWLFTFFMVSSDKQEFLIVRQPNLLIFLYDKRKTIPEKILPFTKDSWTWLCIEKFKSSVLPI